MVSAKGYATLCAPLSDLAVWPWPAVALPDKSWATPTQVGKKFLSGREGEESEGGREGAGMGQAPRN